MKMRNAIFVSIAFSLPLTLHAFPAATGKIEGIVYTAETREPLEGVNVVLLGTILGSATDAKGNFTIPRVEPGAYTLVISAIGYKELNLEINVIPHRPVRVEAALEETVLELGGLVVTAGKYHQSLHEVPTSLSLLQSQDIMRRNLSTVNEALKYVPGVSTMGNQINIRGASGFSRGLGTRVLVLLDGVPFIRGDDNDVDWDAISTTQVEQVEVLKGAGSALYGSSALGGVVNIILKDPGEHYNFFVRTFTGFYDKPQYESWIWNNKSHHYEGTTVSYSGKIFGVGTWLSSTWKNNTGFRENDDNETINFMSKFTSRPHTNLKLDLLAGYSKKHTGLFLFWKSYTFATRNGGDYEGTATRSSIRETYLHPSLTHFLSSKFSYTVKGRYMRTFSEDRLDVFEPESPYEEGIFRHSASNSFGGEVQCNVQYASQGILVLGIDGQIFKINSQHFGSPRAHSYAGFFQNEYRPFRHLKATIGARYDAQVYDNSARMQGWNPKIGFNYALSPLSSLRLSVSKGFRAPAPAEKFISTFTNQVKIIPNPELKPEHSLSSEIGIHKTMLGTVNFDIAAYHSDFWELIEVRPQQTWGTAGDRILPELKFMNVTRARVRGIETSLRTQLVKDFLNADISYAYLHSIDLSRNEDGTPSEDYGKSLKYRSRHLFLLASDLYFRGLSAGFDFRYVSPIERVDEFQRVAIKDLEVTPATYVTDVRVALQWGNFKFHFFINNIFQNYYLEHPACLGAFRNYNLQIDFIS